MNSDDLFSAIGTAEEKHLQQSETPLIKKLRPWIALAACLCILITSVLIFRPDTSSPVPILTDVLPEHHISDEQILLTNTQTAEVSYSDFNFMLSVYSMPDYQFLTKMSIEAKVLGVLPDVYTFPGALSTAPRYHVLHLQVLDVIVGENMPREIYYLIPDFLSTDLGEYDSLIMAVQQQGLENYTMINQTQQRAETFSILFHCGSFDPDQGGVLAFKDGTLDTGLWKIAGWNCDKEGYTPEHLLSDKCPNYPGKLGRSLEQTKQVIRQLYDKLGQNYYNVIRSDTPAVSTNADLDWQEAQALLDYVQPFKNGIFEQSAQLGQIQYQRLINGLRTNEYHTIYYEDKKVTSSGVQFTQEDLQQLPDIDAAVNAISDMPRRSDQYPFFCGIRGWYWKTEDGIYAVLGACWGSPTTEKSRIPSCVIVSSTQLVYYLVKPDGSWQETTQEELSETIGFIPYI